ncbi:MAG: phosphoglycerate kinase [Methanobacterium sp.]|nr:MAG: phosphoglycerate kinase [Methanobacterium sp.]
MSLDIYTMDDLKVKDKTILVRVDVNSPVDPKSGFLLDDTRIKLHAETIRELQNKGAKTVLLAHQSRPGKADFTTLKYHAEALSEILGKPVEYVDDIFGSNAKNRISQLQSGEVLVLENVRFYSEEVLKRDPKSQAETHLVEKLTPVVDYYINDAFAAAHRSQPSLVGFALELPSAAGRVMERELKILYNAVYNAERPRVYVLGGVKVDDSIAITENLLKKGSADYILTTGLVANIFLWGAGINIKQVNKDFIKNKNYCEWVLKAKKLLKEFKGKILYPKDVAIPVDNKRKEFSIKKIPNKSIYDIGSDTINEYAKIIRGAGTIFANGPAGVFEEDGFSLGTEDILNAIASSSGLSIIGGGHMAAAANQMGLTGIDHISSGGGASISLLAGDELPVVEVLKQAKSKFKL